MSSFRSDTGSAADAMARRMPVNEVDLAGELRELIAALDRRVPRVEQAGEASIAHDASVLREKAVRRLAELTGRVEPGTTTVERAARTRDEPE